jgi:prolipoprotein diacylglyceryltransferase
VTRFADHPHSDAREETAMLASIPSPASNGIHLGPLEVRVYGLMYLVGLFAAIAITARRWERQGGSRNSFTRSPSGPSPPG